MIFSNIMYLTDTCPLKFSKTEPNIPTNGSFKNKLKNLLLVELKNVRYIFEVATVQ